MTISTPETDTISPPVSFKEYRLLDGDLVLTQKPLSFFGKMELMAVLGNALEHALSEGGASVTDLLSGMPGDRSENLSLNDFRDADAFVKGIAKLIQYTPDLMGDLYCVALGIPRGQREYVKGVMELHESEGGLSDDQGIEIFDTFIEQNWQVLVDFFKQKIIPIFEKMGSKSESQPSKPQKVTRARTAKR